MNLLEKARLIQEIRDNLKQIEHSDTLIEKAKATYRLKEIIQICSQPNLFQAKKNSMVLPEEKDSILDIVQTSEYKKSYCGAYHNKQMLLSQLNKCNAPQWAILYQTNQTFWQIWVNLGPHRSIIYSDWYRQLKDAYTWLIEQQQFFLHLKKDLS